MKQFYSEETLKEKSIHDVLVSSPSLSLSVVYVDFKLIC